MHLGCGLAEKFHPVQRKEIFGHLLSASIDFVITVTAPYAHRRSKAAEFGYAFGKRIPKAGDKVSGDHSQVWHEIVGDLHCPAYILQRHKVANVDIAQLNDPESVEGPRKTESRNFDPDNLKPQSFPRVAIKGHCKRRTS